MVESGQRNLETSYFCPDITRLNFLPFAPEENIQTAVNVSGTSGPIDFPRVGANINSLSGVLGAGTFYPGSGTLEELSRLFWCVRSWSLQVTVSASLPSIPASVVDPLSLFLQSVSLPNTTFGTITNSIGTKNLHLLDIYHSGVNVAAPLTPQKVVGQAIPIDPIIRWDELMCRNKYFSWSPPNDIVTGFWKAKTVTNYINSPYAMNFPITLSQALPDGTISPPCYGMYFLSIMNTDRYSRPSQTLAPTGKSISFYTPSGIDSVDQNSYFLAPLTPSKTGTLTDASGVITGYGFLPQISGEFPILMYSPRCDPSHDPSTSGCVTNPTNNGQPNNYYPLIDFALWIKTFSNVVNAPSFATIVSTVKQSTNWSSAGQLRIMDANMSGLPNSTATGLNAKAMFTCPLFTPATTKGQQVVTVNLIPASFWLTTSGTINY